MRQIDTLVLHCTDTPDHMDVGVPEINDWHVQRGWNGIGYHWVIRRNGALEQGRPESMVGAHVEGHNQNSIGVCWVGRNTPSPEQITQIVSFLNKLLAKYNLATNRVFGHCEFNGGKTCPNLDMQKIRNQLSNSNKP